MKLNKKFIISIIVMLMMTATYSCSRDEKKEIEVVEQEVEKKDDVMTHKPVIKKQEDRIVFEAGESLATMFPKTWPTKAQQLEIPLYKSKWGERTNMLQNGVYYYTYIFPGDYIQGGEVYDKSGKPIDFDARIEWHKNH